MQASSNGSGKKIFILGVGAAGSECVRDLLSSPDVGLVTLADFDQSKAEALRIELRDDRVRVVPADVNDVAATSRSLAGHDVMLNALSPTYFSPALEAACRAKVNYADLYSHPTEEQRSAVKTAGIAALSGLGATPGISNVLGKKACGFFDEVEEAHFSHANLRFIAPTQAALDFAALYAGRPDYEFIRYYFNGEFVRTAPFERSRIVDFGNPLGKYVVYIMPHTQSATFPRNFPSLKLAISWGTWMPETMAELGVLRRSGLLDDVDIQTKEGTVNVRKVTKDQIWRARGAEPTSHFNGFGVHVEVRGKKDGKFAKAIYRLAHSTDWYDTSRLPIMRMTGIGASIGILLLLRNNNKFTGILEPEAYFEPDIFLSELTARPGIVVSESIEWEQSGSR